MAIEIREQRFVHVVAIADIDAGTGQILYVNPADVGVVGAEGEAGDYPTVQLVAEDADGNTLVTETAAVRRDPCADETTAGLVQHHLAHKPGMRRIRMLLDGAELAVYESPAGGAVDAGAVAGMSFGIAPPPSPHRRLVELPGIAAELGVTYTVMVKPDGDERWHATSVGVSRPTFELDRNQFPGAKQVTVRVLRSTGFDDSVIAEESVPVEGD